VDPSASYRLVIADDHPLFRGALRAAVASLFADAEIAEAGSFDESVKLIERGGDVDLVLLDLTMPGVRGFSGLMFLRAQFPSVPVVVVSANDDPAVIRRWHGIRRLRLHPKNARHRADAGRDIARAQRRHLDAARRRSGGRRRRRDRRPGAAARHPDAAAGARP